MSRTEKFRHLDWPCIGLMTALVMFGVVMIGSANGWVYDREHFSADPLMVKQLIGFGIGIVAITVLMLLPYKWVKALSIPAFLAVIGLLVAVLRFGTGAMEGDEVSRWLPLTSTVSIQPSELGKIALIMMLAWFFEHLSDHVNNLLVLIAAVLIALIPLFLIYKEPDLSTSLVVVAIVFACFFEAKVSWWYVLLVITLFIGAGYIIIQDAVSEAPKLLSAYQAERILAWLHPEDYALTTAYQSMQSRTAIGTGGLLGVGLFHNAGMVPIATTDFIFGIIGEELGLVGASIVMALYFALSARILLIGGNSNDLYGRVICAGVAVMISIQALIHMGVCIAVLPNTGLPLPFISYGQSSLTANMIGIGLILRVNAENRESRLRRFTA